MRSKLHLLPFWVSGLLLCLVISKPATVNAQSLAPELGVGLIFNHTDIMADFNGGICFPEIGLSTKLSFQPRLGAKRVLLETETPNVLVQYRERRYLLGIEADKRFSLSDITETAHVGAFVGGFIGLNFNGYRGTNEPGQLDLGWEIMAGPYLYDEEGILLRLGYVYLPLNMTSNVFAHRVGLSISFVINDN
jgi:hypothetical protein